MDRLGAVVRRELGRFEPGAGMARVVDAWPRVVGAEIARNAWPARLARDGTLHANVSSAAWSFELAHLEPEIMSRLREALGEAAPARLRFSPGPLPEFGAESVKKVGKVAREPSAHDRARAAEIAAGIEDEGLRKVVSEAAAASLARASDDRSV